MRLADDLQKIQYTEFFVSGKGEKEGHQPIWRNVVTVFNNPSCELRPRQDAIGVHGPFVLSEFDRLLASRRLFQIQEIVCNEPKGVGVHQFNEAVMVAYLLDLHHSVERSFARVKQSGRRCAPGAV